MTRRVTVFVLAWVCLGFLIPRPTRGLRIIVEGTYVDEVNGQQDTWSGEFDTDGARLEGAVTLGGIKEATKVGASGSLSAQQVDLRFKEDAGLKGVFKGRVAGGTLHGIYIAGSRRGTWAGKWDVDPGAPAPEVEQARISQVPLEQPPVGRPVVDPDDPRGVCALLDDEIMIGNMSGTGEMGLRQLCNQHAAASNSTKIGVRTLLAAAFRSFFGLSTSIVPVVGDARAQPQPCTTPQANPVNCRETDSYPLITQSEVSIAVSGRDQQIVIVGFNDISHTNQNSIAGYSRSTDGGNTWLDAGFIPPPPLGRNNGDPIVVGDVQGNFYFGHVAVTSGGRSFIGVSSSVDDGRSFAQPIDASPGTSALNTQDKPEMAVDRNAGNIYACWTEIYLDSSTQPPTKKSRILFSRSVDQGHQNYSSPMQLSSTATILLQGCSVAVGRQGYVYVAWWDRGSNLNLIPDPSKPDKILLRRSTNGGADFGAAVTVGTAFSAPVRVGIPEQYPDEGCGSTPSLASPDQLHGIRWTKAANLVTDPLVDNNVYATWHTWDTTLQSSEINFSRSTDGGQTWSSPVRLNNVTTNDQFMPRMATTILTVPPNPPFTKIRVVWYDRQRDPANLNVDVFQTTSINGGQGWQANSQLNDTSSPLPIPQTSPYFDCRTSSCYFGDYNGLSGMNPANSLFITGWGDTRLTASGAPCGFLPSTSPDPDVRVAVGC